MSIPDDEDLASVRRRELGWLEQCGSDAHGLDAAVVALDPYRWSLVRFALWARASDELDLPAPATGYEVLHLSSPGL